jgi:hypothetical protein
MWEVDRSCPETLDQRLRLNGRGPLHFPHLPTKNVGRYGAPVLVEG